MDILWPRWVARIGVTRSTQACFLAADRQCTELPLLRLPRLVPEVVGCDPFAARDLARVGWRELAPFLPIGPRERPRLADSFSRLGQARGASPGSLDQRSEEWPLMRRKERGPRGTPPSTQRVPRPTQSSLGGTDRITADFRNLREHLWRFSLPIELFLPSALPVCRPTELRASPPT